MHLVRASDTASSRLSSPRPHIQAHGGTLGMAVISPHVRAGAGVVGVLLCAVIAGACGSSSPSSSSTAPSTSAAGGMPSTSASSTASSSSAAAAGSARRLETALLATNGPPRPTSASCRPASAAERAAAPFGQTTPPVFVCLLAVEGQRATFDVQLLNNGCYVAERTPPGQAIYGCEAS